jgi:hypothetical protein
MALRATEGNEKPAVGEDAAKKWRVEAGFSTESLAWPCGPPKGMKNRPVAKMRRTKWRVEAGFSTERTLVLITDGPQAAQPVSERCRQGVDMCDN